MIATTAVHVGLQSSTGVHTYVLLYQVSLYMHEHCCFGRENSNRLNVHIRAETVITFRPECDVYQVYDTWYVRVLLLLYT